MAFSFGEVQTFVSNLESAIAFYRDQLGLTLLQQGEQWAIFNISGVEFVLMAGATPDLHRTYGKICKTVLCLKSTSIEDDIGTLKQQGVTIIAEVKTVPQGKFAVIADQDGNSIEIIQN